MTPSKKEAGSSSPGHRKRKEGAASSDMPVIPSANELGGTVVGASGSGAAGDEATLQVFAMPFCNDGSVYGDQFDGELLAIHFLYLGYPNVLYNILKTMSAYVEFAHGEDETEPCSLDDLNEKNGLKIVATSIVFLLG